MDQGLPVNFENTASTWQNMPGMAAFYTGLQNQAAQDNIQMLQRAFAEEQAFKGQTRPLEMEKMRGLNELQAAQAMSARATGRKTGLDADLMAGTLASDIGAKKGTNALALKENQVKEGAAKAAMFNQMSGWLKGDGRRYPPTEQVRVVMEKLGIEDTPDRRVSTGLLENLNKLPDMFAAEYNHLVKSSPDYQKESMKEAGANQRNAATNATQIGVANINAESRQVVQAMKDQAKEQVKNVVDAALSGKMTYEKAATALHMAATLQPNHEDAPKWAQMAAQFEKMNIAAPVKPGATNMSTVTGMPAAQPSLVLGAPAASAPGKPGTLADVKKMYPGVSDEKLKEAYKKKFGVDLQ